MACCCRSKGVPNDKFSSFSGACYIGNMDKMKQQLRKEKDKQKAVNCVNEDGMSPLHRAAQKGSAEVIKFLLDNNADPRQQSKKTGETPLHIACFHRNKAAVLELLKSSAMKDVNVQDQHGYTPLLVAVNRGSADIAEMLMTTGANPHIKDNYGQDSVEMAKFLREQEEQGLSSPTAEHRRTYQIVTKPEVDK